MAKHSIFFLLLLCGLHLTLSFHVPWRSHASSASISRLFSTSAEEDWRAFRARLVMRNGPNSVQDSEQNDADRQVSPTASSSSWAYDAGLLVEKGSIVLSRVESKLSSPDLDQPFFNKCVVLIVEHDDSMTQGIILNRPSDLRLDGQGNVLFPSENDDSAPILLEEFAEDRHNVDHWRLFFGGEISGYQNEEEDDNDDDIDDDDDTLIICLHNLATSDAREASDQILPGVYMTSHSVARSLVESGDATPDDFYVFYGFCGWDPDQLQIEVQNGSWYLASTDPQTLWDDLAVMRDDSYDARNAGLQMWDNLIHRLGKQKQVENDSINQGDFSDLMLKEWVTQMLVVRDENGSGINGALDDASIFRALQAADRPPVQPGSLLRGSSLPDSPYLLKDQYLHKSTVLILQEEENASFGMILNLPTTDTLSVQINNSTFANFTIRFGGPSYFAAESTMEDKTDIDTEENRKEEEDDQEPMVWLHCCAGLKFLRTGKPLVAGDENGVWTCTREQVTTSIDLGFASVDDFMLVKGFCLWEKEAESGGVLGQIMSGNLEPVAADKIDAAWTTLRRQHHLSKSSFLQNFAWSQEAWVHSADAKASKDTMPKQKARFVFGSSVGVEELADRALSNWIKIHLLDNDDSSSSS